MSTRPDARHGRARRHPVSSVWLVLGGVALALIVTTPVLLQLFGGAS